MYWPRLVRKRHITLRLTYHSTTIFLIFLPMLLVVPKYLLGWKPTIFKQIPSPLVQILSLTHDLRLLYSVVRISNLTLV